MDVLTIVLVVLLLAVIWLVVELVVTVRRARPAIDAAQRTIDSLRADVDKLSAQATPVLKGVEEAVAEARPVIAHVDELVTQASPAASDVSPLLSGATKAVEDLSANLTHLDAILADVSHITGSASNATQAVGAATTSIVDRVRGRFGLGRSGQVPASDSLPAPTDEVPAALEGEQEGLDVVEAERADVIRADEGYFTYPAAEPKAKA